MSKALSELNTLCDVLSRMRKPTAPNSANQMYKRFCKPGAGVMRITYIKDRYSRIFLVHFEYISWIGMCSTLSVDTTKYY